MDLCMGRSSLFPQGDLRDVQATKVLRRSRAHVIK
jgi:hypothetical protein